MEWQHSKEEDSECKPDLRLYHPISIEPNELDDEVTWEDVGSGNVDAPGITIKGRSGSICLTPVGDQISLQATVGDLYIAQFVPNPGGSK